MMSGNDTSLSLLDKLARRPDSASWARLVDLYSPLLRDWLCRYRIQPSDSDDLVQEVLSTVYRELPRFEHNQRPGAFRSWLRTILVHRLQGFWRSQRNHPGATGDSEFARQLGQLADRDSSLSRLWNEQHDRYVVNRVLALVRPKVTPTTWEAFRRQSLEGIPAHEVAGDLGMSVAAVYAAKSRVLRMLRQEVAGLVE
jgi:RNA polymerase sigma-70 factor (ECF subfamily)